MNNFIVKDSFGNKLTSFEKYQQAYGFVLLAGRMGDWKIVEDTKSTQKQRNAVYMIENITRIPFTGDINNKQDVSIYLDRHMIP